MLDTSTMSTDKNGISNPPLNTEKRKSPASELANRNIRELNKIDDDISSLLLSAGLAIKSLTTPVSTLSTLHPAEFPSPQTTSTAGNTPERATISSQQAAFKHHAVKFQTLLDSIQKGIRKQIIAQEKAEILAPIPGTPGSNTSSGGFAAGVPVAAGIGGQAGGGGGITGVGVGLDVGALNIKSDSVGKDMEEELWKKAKEFIHDLERQRDEDRAELQLRWEGAAGRDGDVTMG